MTLRTWVRRFFGLPSKTLKQACRDHQEAMNHLEKEVEQTTITLSSGRWKNRSALRSTEIKVHHGGD